MATMIVPNGAGTDPKGSALRVERGDGAGVPSALAAAVGARMAALRENYSVSQEAINAGRQSFLVQPPAQTTIVQTMKKEGSVSTPAHRGGLAALVASKMTAAKDRLAPGSNVMTFSPPIMERIEEVDSPGPGSVLTNTPDKIVVYPVWRACAAL